MHRYRRLIVGLNLSDQDKTTIRYAAMFSRMAKPKAIHFVHIVARLKIPMSIRLRYPNLFRPVMNQKEEMTYTLVFPDAADIMAGKISVLAPIGTACWVIGREIPLAGRCRRACAE